MLSLFYTEGVCPGQRDCHLISSGAGVALIQCEFTDTQREPSTVESLRQESLCKALPSHHYRPSLWLGTPSVGKALLIKSTRARTGWEQATSVPSPQHGPSETGESRSLTQRKELWATSQGSSSNSDHNILPSISRTPCTRL